MGLFSFLTGGGSKQPAPSAPDYETLLAQSMAELGMKTQAHDATWHLSEADWNVDQDDGQIVFEHQGITATAPVQIVGTYNCEDSTWLWAWGNPSIYPALQEDAKRVREYGEKHGLTQLTTRKLVCSESEAWEFTAVACKLGEGQGAYRGPSGNTFTFMTFGDVVLSSSAGAEPPPCDPAERVARSPATPVTGAPADVVRAFIAAYCDWSMAAWERSESVPAGSSSEEADKLATSEYDDLIARFCASTVKRQGISFGNEPSHHPEEEELISLTISGETALVETCHVGPGGFVSDYDYHLVQEGGEWRIASLLYVQEDEKFECL